MTPVSQKEISLTIISAALSLILIGGILPWLLASPNNTALLIAFSVVAVIWIIMTALTLYSTPHWWPGVTISTVATLTTIAAGQSWGALGGGILLGLMCAGARRAFQQDRLLLRYFHTARVFRTGTKFLVIGLVLAVAGLALPYLEGSIRKDGLEISPRYTALALRPLQPVIEGYFPNISAASSVNDLIDSQLRLQGINPADLSAEQREEIRQQIEERLNLEVTGRESLGDIIAGRINTILKQLTQANPLIVAVATLVLVFLTIRAIIPIATWVLLLGIAAVVWVGAKTSLLIITKETIEVETLTL